MLAGKIQGVEDYTMGHERGGANQTKCFLLTFTESWSTHGLLSSFLNLLLQRVFCKASLEISWWDRNRTALHTQTHANRHIRTKHTRTHTHRAFPSPSLGYVFIAALINNSTPVTGEESRDRGGRDAEGTRGGGRGGRDFLDLLNSLCEAWGEG